VTNITGKGFDKSLTSILLVSTSTHSVKHSWIWSVISNCLFVCA